MSPESRESPSSEVEQAQASSEREPEDGPSAALSPASPLRFVFLGLWFFLVPAALAVGVVKLLKPEPLERLSVGWLRTFVDEQQVPATIMFFTLFAMALWRVRHILPMAKLLGMLPRAELPARLRARYEEAQQLVVEARRIMAQRKKELASSMSEAQRTGLRDALDSLERVMMAQAFNEERFGAASDQAQELVVRHLGHFRKGEAREYAESIGFAVVVALLLRFFVIEAFKIPSGSMIPTLMIGDHIFVAKYAYGPLLPQSDYRLYESLPPDRGDVAVFKFPENKADDYIKRVVALPGDRLEVLDGRPVINGWLAPQCSVGSVGQANVPGASAGYDGEGGHLYVEYLGKAAYLTMYRDPHETTSCDVDDDCRGGRACRGGVCGVLYRQKPFIVPQRQVWVMGDNRNNSHDSRGWNHGRGAGVPFENLKGRALFVWWSWAQGQGVATDRLFVNVMGRPKAPRGVAESVQQKIDECLAARPPIGETTPPTESAATRSSSALN